MDNESEMSKKSAGAKRANYCFSLLNMQFCDEGVVFVAVVVVVVKPGFEIVVPVARIVSVALNFWTRQGRSYRNALAITQDDPCDRSDQSSEIDSSSILATETTGKDSQAISHFK